MEILEFEQTKHLLFCEEPSFNIGIDTFYVFDVPHLQNKNSFMYLWLRGVNGRLMISFVPSKICQ